MNSIYDNLLRSNKVNITSPKSYDLRNRGAMTLGTEKVKEICFRCCIEKNKSNKLYVISLLGINLVCFYPCLLVLLLMMNTVYVFEISS